MSILKVKDKNGNLINIPTHAIEMPILDLGDYYTSENVEGALREIGEKICNGVATKLEIEALVLQINAVKKAVADLDVNDLTGLDIDTLNAIIQAYKDGSLGQGGGIDEQHL